MEVLDDESDANWWNARNEQGQEGYIPANYVTEIKREVPVESHPWFFADMSRSSAEMMLKQDGREGVYLVRKSEQAKGYTIGIFSKEGKSRDAGIVKHYHIKRNDQGLCVIIFVYAACMRVHGKILHILAVL